MLDNMKIGQSKVTAAEKKYKILSIDAWVGQEEGMWEWNDWHTVGTLDALPEKDDEIIDVLIDEGYLKSSAKSKVYVDDDQYNLVICDKKDDRPLYAVEYGSQH